nr:hypothetical protein [Tanacetum cinerariifolium]
MRTRSSNFRMATLFANLKRQFQARRDISPAPIHNIYYFYESESSESESKDVGEIDIETLTLEQYFALDLNNTRRRISNPEDATFEIKGKNLRELRKTTFSGSSTENAIEHIRKVLKVASLFDANDSVLLRVFPLTLAGGRFYPPAIILKQLGEIRNFKQENQESLFHTWERYNDLLFKFPFHDLNNHQKVNTFYNGLKGQTQRFVDSNGLIHGLTASEALNSIQ